MVFQLGLGYAWTANGAGNVNTFMQVFRTRVSDCCRQANYGHKLSSPKAIRYRIYKTYIFDECYLLLSMPYPYKRALEILDAIAMT
jgi:hypothetical protein